MELFIPFQSGEAVMQPFTARIPATGLTASKEN